ncbi:MAG: sugar ABC transporter permease [Clostridiales bacterium]|nr:sugar ABC transporter permease [Clostridiales bacterium]
MDKSEKPAKRGITMAGKNAIAGYMFILPFVIGFVMFMAYPLVEAVQMSFSVVTLDTANNRFNVVWITEDTGDVAVEVSETGEIIYSGWASLDLDPVVRRDTIFAEVQAQGIELNMLTSTVDDELETTGFALAETGEELIIRSVPRVTTRSLIGHYNRVFAIEPEVTRAIVDEIMAMVFLVPAILIFSLFIAVLLNREFPGRGFVRAVFFLPVILASGVLVGIETNNTLLTMVSEQIQEANTLRAGVTGVIERMLENFVGGSGMGDFLEYLLAIINQIYDIAMASGIQILIFLAGLQSINVSIYEAASIEGATGWENFWKITFPMISPMILVAVVYSIIDFMVRTDSAVMEMVQRSVVEFAEYGYGTAMAMSYFLIIAAILGVLAFIISRLVYYYD